MLACKAMGRFVLQSVGDPAIYHQSMLLYHIQRTATSRAARLNEHVASELGIAPVH